MRVFGGRFRNVDDENVAAMLVYAKRLVQRSEHIGYDLSLVAELNQNDIKGVAAPSLDAWNTATAPTVVTVRGKYMAPSAPRFTTRPCWRNRPRTSTKSAAAG